MREMKNNKKTAPLKIVFEQWLRNEFDKFENFRDYRQKVIKYNRWVC